MGRAVAADPLRIAMLQLNVGDDPTANLTVTRAMLARAAAAGAAMVLTPEATNLLSPDRAHQGRVLRPEAEDMTLAALRSDARDLGVWMLIGGLALRAEDPADKRFVNRSLMIDPTGAIVARYDKLHMFDVTISETESYRESAAYRPGDRAVLSPGPAGPVGLSICYDVRFPQLYRRLAQAGARMLCVPAAFNPTTGAAHWEVLLRARAIETGCFVLAPAQCGTHAAPHSPDRPARRSHGHSLAVGPWGEILADGGTEPGIVLADLDVETVDRARSRIPTLTHDRPFDGP